MFGCPASKNTYLLDTPHPAANSRASIATLSKQKTSSHFLLTIADVPRKNLLTQIHNFTFTFTFLAHTLCLRWQEQSKFEMVKINMLKNIIAIKNIG